MKTCILTPTVKINGKEQTSKLFEDLSKSLKNRNDVIEIWSLFQVPEVGELYGLKKVNGEYLANDVLNALNINVLEDKLSRTFLKKQAGFISENNEDKIIKKYSDAIKEVNSFNSNHSYNNAVVVKTKGGYTIDVIDRSLSNDIIKQQNYNNELSYKLLSILHQLGFDVKIIEDLEQDGIFDPMNAEKTADGLIQIIKLAKGERGEKALPEEFSHMIISGLRNNPLIRRALEYLSNEQVEQILGDKYEQYVKDYNNNTQQLKEECLGQMLSDYLQGNINHKAEKDKAGFLSRIWNYLKSLFSRITENDIDRAVNNAKRTVEQIADEILKDEFDFDKLDKNEIFSSKTMYKVSEGRKTIENLALKARKKLALLTKEKAAQTTSGLFTDEQKETLKNLNKQIEDGKYKEGCLTFLDSALKDIESFQEDLKKYNELSESEINKRLRTICATIVNLKNHKNTYEKIIKELSGLSLTYKEVKISQEDGEEIANVAKRVLGITAEVDDLADVLKFKAATEFLKPFWKDKKITTRFIEDQMITIDTLLHDGFNDITWADSFVNAVVESSDILLSLMGKITIHQQDLRDERLLEDDRYIREHEQKLRDAGIRDTRFMFDFDENGVPTGYLISDRNTAQYEKDKKAKKEELEKDESLNNREKLERLQLWIENHTTTAIVKYNGKDIEVRVPAAMYKYEEGKSPLDKLSPAQREYYDAMMALKAERESAMPKYKQNLYRAVQKRTDFVEELSNNITNPKELLHKCLEKMKDEFIRREDDTEFGSIVEDGEKIVLLNARDEPVKQVPLFYISELEDMSQLSLDFGGSMRAFAATMDNYEMMNAILPQMLLLNDIIQNRKVTMQDGGKVSKSVKKILGIEYEQTYQKEGKELGIGDAANFLIDKQFYGIKKADEGTVGATQVDTAKLLDFIKQYTSLVGMGLNLYSGISNLTMGGVQMIIEAVADEHFNYKNLAKAHLNYDKDILGCLAEMNSVKRENKLSLLMDKFDSLETFYDSIKDKAFYKNGTLRAVSELNMMILNEIGEHRLHNVTMLAILDHTKLKKGNEEISLYDALEVSKEELDANGNKVPCAAYLKIKDGVTKLDGTEFTTEDFIRIKREVSRTNRRLHGAYSDAFKGAIHQKALGRLVMQFRQWMPAFYSNRFARSYYDVEIDDIEEGYYVTMFKYSTAMMKSIAQMKFEFATNWNNLSPHQQANMKKALTELTAFILLSIACGCMGALKDKKSTWTEKMLYYQMLRLRLEVGAGFPVHPDFFDNIWTMLQSPAAAIKSCNNVTDLLKFWNMFNEIQTGRYQGWSRYHKDFMECIPLYGQVRKAIDLKGEDYMFTLFNNY